MAKNLIARWFDVYRDLGQPIDVHVLRFDQRTQQVLHERYPHTEWDGFSLAQHLLTQLGWRFHGPRKLRSFSLSLIDKVKAFFHYLHWARIRTTPWRALSAQRAGEGPAQMHVFSTDWTAKLLIHLEKEALSLNAWLLYHLHQEASALIVGGAGTWWLPVDYRPFLGADIGEKNVVSHVAVDLTPKSSGKDIDADIRRRIERGDPWAAWTWMNLMARFGKKTMRAILADQLRRNRWCGTMTYMGSWPNRFARAPADTPYRFVGVPPAMLGHPIAVGASLMLGQLCLGAVIHRSLLEDDAGVAFFRRYTARLETSLGT